MTTPKGVKLVSSGLPVIFSPDGDSSVKFLCTWLKANNAWLQEKILDGALLFRGFEIFTPEDFEAVSQASGYKLRDEYLGTSARTRKTAHVYTASEIPRQYPIPQHCEISFTLSAPKKIFFACTLPSAVGGETPICDFRKVYDDLPKDLLERWEKKGLRYTRNYNGPTTKVGLDPVKLKRWDEVFETTDKAAVEKRCKQEEYDYTWRGESLSLVNLRPATITHPVTKRKAWFNHAHIFHPDVGHAEFFQYIKFLRRDFLWTLFMLIVSFVMYLFKKLFVSPSQDATNCEFGDGSAIPLSDLRTVRNTIWKHTVINKWQKGDVVFIDNFAVSHGRLPYSGPRTVLTCMAD